MDGLLSRIDSEISNAQVGKPAHIIIKVNSLVEPTMISAFYRASMAGVKIDLIIRGICCLRPGIAGLSENIRVRSIIGRFLEHTRIYYFENDDEPEVWASSADLMKRNLLRRVEACFPIQSKHLRQQIIDDLNVYLSDNVQAWKLSSDGRYQRIEKAINAEAICAQSTLLEQMAKTY
jgi:polyphosphate kinase